MRRTSVVLLLGILGAIFATIVINYSERTALPALAKAYVNLVPRELGAPNVITGILLTYRAFDTLGEVAVLFMVAAGIGLLLGAGEDRCDEASADHSEGTRPTEIVSNGAEILVPLIATFAAYIVMHGHLGPGGGFQGGAVMASCVLLLVLTKPEYRVKLSRLSAIESLAGLFIVFVGIAGIILAGGFLDNRILPLGEFGAFFSAGAIPVFSVLLGAKVGSELSVIIERFEPDWPDTGGGPVTISTVVLATGLALMLIGICGMLTQRDILRILIGFSLMGTGSHIVIIAIGYVAHGTAPIIDAGLSLADAPARSVDPIPSALAVTAIVIGFAVTAVMLAYAIRLYEAKKTLSIDAFTESKW